MVKWWHSLASYNSFQQLQTRKYEDILGQHVPGQCHDGRIARVGSVREWFVSDSAV